MPPPEPIGWRSYIKYGWRICAIKKGRWIAGYHREDQVPRPQDDDDNHYLLIGTEWKYSQSTGRYWTKQFPKWHTKKEALAIEEEIRSPAATDG